MAGPRKQARSSLALSHRFKREYRELIAAIQFLSILPLPRLLLLEEDEEDHVPLIVGSGYFSLVGALLALLLSLLPWFLGAVLPVFVLAALLVVAEVILTGGLHLDGLMDSCDGLFGGRTLERKLEIMHDSRQGSFGVLGGICALLLQFALLASLETRLLPLALFVALPTARWSMVLAVYLFPTVRSSGLGYEFRRSVMLPYVIASGLVALLVALIAGHIIGIAVLLISTLVAWGMGKWMMNILGGLTGDLYGAIAVVCEIVALLLLVLLRVWLI